MHTEAVLKESSDTKTSILKEDPKLLGVSLPVSTTIEAAIKVKKAWAIALAEVVVAAKAKTSSAKAKAESVVSNGATEINA